MPPNDEPTERSLRNVLPRELLARLGTLSDRATRKIAIEQLHVSDGSLDDVRIERLRLGSASIGTIEIERVDATLQNSNAFLTDVRSILELSFTLHWEIDLGWIGSWDGTDSLGSLNIPLRLGNIRIPDLDNIDLELPTVRIPSVSARMKPVEDLELGSFSLSAADLEKLTLPPSGFSVEGMDVGDMTLSALTVPDAKGQSLKLDEATPEHDVVLPGALLRSLEMPSIDIPRIRSGSIRASARSSSRGLRADLGILKVTLSVTPTAHLNVGNMTVRDAQLSSTIGQVDISEIRMPVSARGIRARGLKLNDVAIHNLRI